MGGGGNNYILEKQASGAAERRSQGAHGCEVGCPGQAQPQAVSGDCSAQGPRNRPSAPVCICGFYACRESRKLRNSATLLSLTRSGFVGGK